MAASSKFQTILYRQFFFLNLISELPQSLLYQITFDNFFTLVKLLDHLGARGLGAIGTIRQN